MGNVRGHELDFCTAVNCIDGRVQVPVTRFLQERFGVSYVDMVTEAGPVRPLADTVDSEAKQSTVRRVGLSIEAHNSRVVSVVAHEGCAGNPVAREQQLEQLAESARFLAEHFPDVLTIGLWVSEHGDITEVCSVKPRGWASGTDA